VDRETITQLLEEYHRVGLGGVELTPIYGVKGQVEKNLAYLSPEWCEMLRYTVGEAKRLGMQVDLPPGSGWRMGGDFLPPELAAAKIRFADGEVSIAPSGEKIKRPGPGGGGPAFNPFDRASLEAVMDHFAPYLQDLGIRAQFHDSWEYGTNARLDLLDVFARRYGYRLEAHIADDALPARVRYDLQFLLAELALEEFIRPWTEHCHAFGQLSRNQAHGSPGNLLDLYAACDIPETEVFRRITPDTPLLSKFASSAAHVAGRPLVSSETGTWIGEHFQVTLATLKHLCDNLFVSGINHHVYHGTAYSPADAAWPGWLFYASTQLNPQNSIWRDVPTLNAYVTRCQSVLQDGTPDNDLLVYFPLHDILQDPAHELAGHLHIKGDWLLERSVAETLRQLWKRGYSFDYISDRQIADLTATKDALVAPGGTFKALLVPPCECLPAKTLEQLLELRADGAEVIFLAPAPKDVPGFAGLEENHARFETLMRDVVPETDCEAGLAAAGLPRESLVDIPGLLFIRRRHAQGHYYFLANQGEDAIDTWIELAVDLTRVSIMDPMTGRTGAAAVRDKRVRIQIAPGASLILKIGVEDGTPWLYREPEGDGVLLEGQWQVRFLEGGAAALPEPYATENLGSWADRGRAYAAFAGTAEYSITFDAPAPGGEWLLDLGAVHESARVCLNGREMPTLIGPTYTTELGPLKDTGNQLTIEVTSLAANRIRDLDQRGVPWRIFEDINFVNVDYEPFDASDWPLMPAGLLGPVRLQRLSAHGEI
jgi:hypothetical protein